VWFFAKSKNLSKKVLKILLNSKAKFIIPAIVLAEIKYLQFKLKVSSLLMKSILQSMRIKDVEYILWTKTL